MTRDLILDDTFDSVTIDPKEGDDGVAVFNGLGRLEGRGMFPFKSVAPFILPFCDWMRGLIVKLADGGLSLARI